MKTVEVAIEYILTGLLMLCAFGLPFARLYGFDSSSLGTGNERLVGVLGLAYLFGVVFDKIADTLLSPFEQWQRFRAANDRQNKERCPTADGFPQDALEYRLRKEAGGHLEWMDSLRSRIRTTRGLAVWGLPAALGIALYQHSNPLHQSLWHPFPHLAIALNLLFIIVALLLSTLLQIVPSDPTKNKKLRENKPAEACSSTQSQIPSGSAGNQWHPSKWFEIKRTEEFTGNKKERENVLNEVKPRVWIRASPYLLMQAVSAAGVIVLACSRPPDWQSACSLSCRCAVLAVGGIVFALFALWVWYQITYTYMKFLAQGLPLEDTPQK